MVENADNKRKSKHRSVFWCSFPQTTIAVRLDQYQCAFRLIGGHFHARRQSKYPSKIRLRLG